MSIIHDMFDPREGPIVEQFEAYKSALADTFARSDRDRPIWTRETGMVWPGQQAQAASRLTEVIATLEKSVSPDQLSSVNAQLDQAKAVMSELGKDLTTSSPLSTGYVPYDLQAPAKFLVPRLTPLRNEIPREPGQGLVYRFKRVTGISNAGVGGVADLNTFFNSETTTNTFGGVTGLRRPPKISYAGDDQSVNAVEQGVSDSVTWKAQFAGQGFEDMRQLSSTAALWAHLLGEEKNLVSARGSGTGFEGAITPPVVSALTQQAGGSLANTAIFVVATARGGRTGSQESAISNRVTITPTLNNQVTVTIGTEPVGALGYNIYASTSSGSEVFQGATQGNTFVIKSLATGTAASPAAVDNSADANAFDGFLTTFADPTKSGYVARLNSNFSTTNPSTEYQQAFASLYNSVKADPEEIWIYAGGKVGMSDLLKTASSTGYRLSNQGDDGSHQMGAVVTGIQNEVTSTMVDFRVHPYFPTGTSLIRSRTLPIPNSEVSATSAVRETQPYMGISWPDVQLTYDISTYAFGSLIHYAPAWGGVVLGITN